MLRRCSPSLLLVAFVASSCVSTSFPGDLAPPRAQMTGAPGRPVSHTWVDTTSHEVRVVAGPFRIAPMMMHGHGAMEQGSMMTTPLIPLVWPVAKGLKGFKMRLFTREGQELPRTLLHHLNLLDFGRRDLLYPVPARVFAVGADTKDVMVPDSYSVRVQQGDSLAWYIMWSNDEPTAIEGVYVELVLAYSDVDGAHAPMTTLYIDTNLNVGNPTSFDVPPGRSEKSYEWEPAVGGALLAAGGHMHEYGVEVRLEDAETNKVLFRLKSHTENGEAWVDQKVFRRFFNLFDASIKLKAHHRYRIVGVYDNPTGDTIPAGGMAQIGGLFKPDNWDQWPANDPADSLYQLDVSGMPRPLESTDRE
jgi:hypothetical protein